MANPLTHPEKGAEPQERRSSLRRRLHALWRFASDASYRGMLRLLWHPRPGVFQPFNDTKPDRYPAIFRFVQSRLGREKELEILSFGCGTGEEAFSLRGYFPRARIKAIDANLGSITVACRRLRATPDAKLFFAHANSINAEPAAFYDAIFCMAVLRHGGLMAEGVTRCDHFITFGAFADAIAGFHRCLKEGGLLIVRHSNFRLADTPLASKFETVLRVPLRGVAKTPIFGADNMLMPGVDDPDTVFRKL
jgi:SAM-dependent methyltransferase